MKIPPKLLSFTFLLLSATLASASIAGWLIDGDTHLVAQDPFTGGLKHTFCNHTINMPSTLSFETATDLITDEKPKNGTSLAGVGWFDGTATWASIIYQDEHDDLMYARYNCSLACGSSDPVQQGNLSSLFPAGVKAHPYTGIAAVLLRNPYSMRAYFFDENREIHELSHQDREVWHYDGSLPGKSSRGDALAAAANDAGDVIVVSAHDEHTVTVFELQSTEKWTSAPLSLPNLANESQVWKPKGPQTALHVDTDGTVSLFYIDKDNHLQQLTSAAANRTSWAVQARQPERVWPVAHPKNAELAIAAHRQLSSFWMYYHGLDKRLSELSYNAGTQENATVVKGHDALTATLPPPPGHTSNATGTSTDNDSRSPWETAVMWTIGSVLFALAAWFVVWLIAKVRWRDHLPSWVLRSWDRVFKRKRSNASSPETMGMDGLSNRV